MTRRLRPETLQLIRRVVLAPSEAPATLLDDVVVVDTETTGAGATARLVEVAGVRAKGGRVVDEFVTLVDPEMHIPAFVTAIHGITDKMVKGAPTVRPALEAFLAFVEGRALVAHNAPFDRKVLGVELERAGLLRPAIPVYCTLKMARRAFPDAPNHRLGTLASWLNLSTPKHRALADCHAALGVLNACAERHPGPALVALHGPARTL